MGLFSRNNGEGRVMLVDAASHRKNTEGLSMREDTVRLGMSRLAAQLVESGFTPDIATIFGKEGDRRKLVHQQRRLFRGRARAAAFSLPFTEGCTVGSSTVSLDHVYPVMRQLREKGVPVICGGPAVTLEPSRTLGLIKQHVGDLANGIVAVRGEGDLILPEVLHAYDGDAWVNDPRLSSIDDNIRVSTTHHQLTSDEFDALPPIDYSGSQRGNVAMIEGMNRGCLSGCRYCASKNLSDGRPIRKRSPEALAADLRKFFEAGYLGGHYTDNDALVVGPRKWREFHDVVSQDQHLSGCLSESMMSAYTNVDVVRHFASDDNMQLLRSAGFTNLAVGVQSVHPDVLKHINRPDVDLPGLLDFVHMARRNGIEISVDMIRGLPGTTETSRTVDEMAMLLLAVSGVEVKGFPYFNVPGSDFYRYGGGDYPNVDYARDESVDDAIETLQVAKWLSMSDQERDAFHRFFFPHEFDLDRLMASPTVCKFNTVCLFKELLVRLSGSKDQASQNMYRYVMEAFDIDELKRFLDGSFDYDQFFAASQRELRVLQKPLGDTFLSRSRSKKCNDSYLHIVHNLFW